MELEILQRSPEDTHLALRGRLDTAGVDRVEVKFDAALARGGHGLVDLAGVTFLASLGLRMFVTAAKMLHRRGKRMILIAPSELVAEALHHSSIDELLPVVGSLEEARALLAQA